MPHGERFLAHRWLLALIALGVLGDQLGGMAFDHIIRASQIRFSRVYHGGVDAAVLVLGDSRAVNAIYAPVASAVLHEPVFNLGYYGVSTTVQEALLEDYLEHNSAPLLVVIEVTSLDIAAQEMLSEMKTYTGLSSRLRALYAEAYPAAARAARVTRLFRYNSELFLRALYYLRHDDQADIWRFGVSPALLREVTAEPAWRLLPKAANLDALVRMASVLSARRIRLRLFVSPYLPGHAARLANPGEFVQLVQRRVGVPVCDYSSALQDVALFTDRLHVNEAGSRALLERLAGDGFFAPRGGADPCDTESLRPQGGPNRTW